MATWQDIVTIAKANAAAEGVDNDDTLYRLLANRALGVISSYVGHFDTYWNNDSTDTTHGTLTLDDADVTFPTDLVDIKQVYWDESLLGEYMGADGLERDFGQFRFQDGTPNSYLRQSFGLTLNCIPTGSTDGLLKVYGLGTIPEFSQTQGGADPLSYIVSSDQLLIADYVVANLPIQYKGQPREVVAAMRETRSMALQRWNDGLQILVSNIQRRKLPLISGD